LTNLEVGNYMNHNLTNLEVGNYMNHNLTNEQKVAAIRDFNRRQGLPIEDPNKVLFNGAIFEESQLDFNLFLIPHYEFKHPLSSYPQVKQYELLTQYGRTLADVNDPYACFIGVPGREPGNLSVTIDTKEVNLKGYWILVQRTVFLHQADPIVSIDIIATSNVLAIPGCPCPPDDIFYIRPADLWLPQP